METAVIMRGPRKSISPCPGELGSLRPPFRSGPEKCLLAAKGPRFLFGQCVGGPPAKAVLPQPQIKPGLWVSSGLWGAFLLSRAQHKHSTGSFEDLKAKQTFYSGLSALTFKCCGQAGGGGAGLGGGALQPLPALELPTLRKGAGLPGALLAFQDIARPRALSWKNCFPVTLLDRTLALSLTRRSLFCSTV